MRCVFAVLTAFALAAPAAAQAAAARPADEAAVRSAVEDFLTRLGDGRYDTLDADFTSKALIIVARERNGAWTNQFETGEEWLAALKKNATPTKFREPIANVRVTIDNDRLAYVRADFQVVRDGKTLSSGVDQFTLVRDGERWKIAVIAYTSVPAS